jgi:uncharacterized membrane protein YidH (DUF202 family)
MPTEQPRSLARERTALGWQRSSLSLAVISGLLLVHAVHRDEPLGVVGAVLVALGAAHVAMAGSRLYRRRLAVPATPAPGPLLGLVAVTLGAAAVAAAELLGSG